MTHKHDGQWLIGGKCKVIYGATRLPFAERVKAAQALVEQEHRRAARAGRRGRRAHARSSPGQSTRLRIWGSGVRISSGAPALSTHLPCKKYCHFTEFARSRTRANFAPNALVHRAVVGVRAQGWWRSTSSMSCRIHTIG